MESSHHRVLSIRLRGLERHCNEILEWMNGPVVSSTLEERTNDLRPDEKEKVGEVVLRIKEEIRRLAAEMELERSTLDIRRAISSLASAMWVDLEETKSDSLKGYGKVSDQFRAHWDPKVDVLLDEVQALENLLNKGR
jgi:hypothetical protein